MASRESNCTVGAKAPRGEGAVMTRWAEWVVGGQAGRQAVRGGLLDSSSSSSSSSR